MGDVGGGFIYPFSSLGWENFGEIIREEVSSIHANALTPVRVASGCLVALAARLKLSELPDVLTTLRQRAGEYLPEVTFAQRVQAEAIRLGLVQVAAASDRVMGDSQRHGRDPTTAT
jgi:hypothetical protein